MARSSLATLTAAAAALLPLASAQLWNTTIHTHSGPVIGFEYFNKTVLERYFNTSESKVAAFLGIPFAASTEYQNRWKPPQPREPWNETYVATEWGAPCPSSGLDYYSEDCLSLNIWTPAKTVSDKLPVMVWNFGSDLTSNDAMYYGGGMAMKDVIFISFNRRDDAFGFLVHPDLNEENYNATGHYSSGNYGILDELEVLKWVQKNIASFGGDPEKVTIAGQSFGSGQTYHAVNSEMFKGTFRAAISESGIRYPYDTLLAGLADSYLTMDDAIDYGVNYTSYHNVSTIAELRELSTADLLIYDQDRVNSTNFWWITALSTAYPLIFKPVLDDWIIPSTYLESLINGPANDVPVITGNNLDESGAATTTNYTAAEYKLYCTLKYGDLADRYFELYPGDNTSQASSSWNAAAVDTSLIGTWAFATNWSESATAPFFSYFWDHSPPNQTAGAYHTSEIFYALNTLYANNDDYTWTEYDYHVADLMSTYWSNFAKTMDPNDSGEGDRAPGIKPPHWAPNNGSRQVMRVGNAFEPVSIAEDSQVTLIMDYFAQQTPF